MGSSGFPSFEISLQVHGKKVKEVLFYEEEDGFGEKVRDFFQIAFFV